MPADFSDVFEALKRLLERQASRLVVQTDAPREYSLVTKAPSSFPQHNGEPMSFAAVKIGAGYVSYHLLPLYMSPTLTKNMSPALRKRMHGKSCFNFATLPADALLGDLRTLTEAAADEWARLGFL